MSSTVVKTSRARQCSTKYTSRNFKVYPDAISRDLVNDSGVDAGTWKLHIIATGTLVVRPVNGPADGSLDQDLGTPTIGTKFEIECSMLVSGTAKVLVMW